MFDPITYILAKNAGGGGGGASLIAGAGISIDGDEIRVKYGEEQYGDPVYDAKMLNAEYTGIGSNYFGLSNNYQSATDLTPLVEENDIVKIVTDDTATGCAFFDPNTGDNYQQNVAVIASQLTLTLDSIYCHNCHGLYLSEGLDDAYLVKDADGNEQTENAYVFGLARSSNDIPVFIVLANNDYPTYGTYTIYKRVSVETVPEAAYDFGAVAVGDNRPVNGDTVKKAINGTGNGITLTMDAAKNLTVALRDALGQTIEDDTVNLPLESMVVGGRYEDGVLYLSIIDQAEELAIPIADIVSGLVPNTRKVAGMPLSSDISTSALAAIIGGELSHVNADWNDNNPDSAAFILNKPTIFSGSYDDLTDVPEFADVALSGSYDDLTDVPEFADVALSGSYDDLNDRPTIPDAQVNADWNATTGVSAISNKPTDLHQFTNNAEDDDDVYASKGFVNSSIATNTAYFRGTYNSVAQLPTTGVTNNDYAFVVVYDTTVTTEVDHYDRYKYSSEAGAWEYEYTLNNSSFTAAQWAAINSGITAALVTKITTNESAISSAQSSITSLQNSKQNNITSSNKLSASLVSEATDKRFMTDAQRTKLNGNLVTGANGGSAIQIVVSSTAPASGTASNVLTLVTG